MAIKNALIILLFDKYHKEIRIFRAYEGWRYGFKEYLIIHTSRYDCW